MFGTSYYRIVADTIFMVKDCTSMFFSHFTKGYNFELPLCFPGTMKLPVYFPFIEGFGLGAWALPWEKKTIFSSLQEIKTEAK